MDLKPLHMVILKGLIVFVLTCVPGISAAEDQSTPTQPLRPTSIQFVKEQREGTYEHLKVVLDEQGHGKFEAKPRDGELITRIFEVSPDTVRQLLASFEALRFLSTSRDFESHLKVADMGLKTVVLERAGKSRKVQFNYTTDKQMNAIAEFLGGLAATELRLEALENTMKYDKLGLPDQLNTLQMELTSRWLAEPKLLLPVLRKLANNTLYFNIVQRKAHELILQIESYQHPILK